jgi:hypothetical protein
MRARRHAGDPGAALWARDRRLAAASEDLGVAAAAPP